MDYNEKQRFKAMWQESTTEAFLRSEADRAASMRFVHSHLASRWRRADKRLQIATMFLSGITGASSVIGSMHTLMSEQSALLIVMFLSLINMGLQAGTHVLKASRHAYEHERASKQFAHFCRHVNTQLAFSEEERGDPRSLLRHTLHNLNSMYQQAPLVDERRRSVLMKVPRQFRRHIDSEIACETPVNENGTDEF